MAPQWLPEFGSSRQKLSIPYPSGHNITVSSSVLHFVTSGAYKLNIGELHTAAVRAPGHSVVHACGVASLLDWPYGSSDVINLPGGQTAKLYALLQVHIACAFAEKEKNKTIRQTKSEQKWFRPGENFTIFRFISV